jgi:hypothetical protein
MQPIELLGGRLGTSGLSWPLQLTALFCDLRPRFLDKGRVGRTYRAIARNGRLLLASDLPLSELAGRVAHLRLQVWHRAILAGDTPEPYGLLICVRGMTEAEVGPIHQLRLTHAPDPNAEVVLDVGGRQMLEIIPKTATSR